ncbi:MAG: ribbon-helix-helix domain-containing protein [Patescibacteria group bacterium]
MQRISVYIPEDTRRRISLAAKAKSKPQSEIIRDALEEGLEVVHPASSSAKALLDLAKMMEKIPTKGKVPKDAVKNMDYYMWGGEKR